MSKRREAQCVGGAVGKTGPARRSSGDREVIFAADDPDLGLLQHARHERILTAAFRELRDRVDGGIVRFLVTPNVGTIMPELGLSNNRNRGSGTRREMTVLPDRQRILRNCFSSVCRFY